MGESDLDQQAVAKSGKPAALPPPVDMAVVQRQSAGYRTADAAWYPALLCAL